MMISINRVVYPLTSLGYGKRFGIWTQGCSIHCEGCMSKDTWEFDISKEISINKLVEWLNSRKIEQPDGITISGGEPFDQSERLLQFLIQINQWKKTFDWEFDVLCYTGYNENIIYSNYSNLLAYIDTLITEPYNNERNSTYLCGSSNQKVIPITPLGKLRYLNSNNVQTNANFQLQINKKEITLIGIPKQNDLIKIQEHCKKHNIALKQTSW
jgi:anaerobic ribonucleoside-triphosphate reductase activating protein